MDMTVSTWVWTACLGRAGGGVSAWLARQRGGRVSIAAGVAAATAAATAWMIGSTGISAVEVGAGHIPGALAFFWIGFVTAGWMVAERDKFVLRQAVCRAATAPAAHPDTVQALAHASPDAVYEAVQGLVPRPVVR
ncbi:MAG TPA: hypothetical protein VMW48_15170 [Vicinamibacterales bacterium]|nr:hypothetical protein [Vicinamibacterales bacterium]